MDALGRVTAYDYDDTGRPIRTHYPDGTTSSTEYDPEGQVVGETDRGGHTTRFEFDRKGRTTAVIYADGTRRGTDYDLAGRPVAETDENGHTTRFTYDATGLATSQTDPLGGVSRFEYNGLGMLVAETDRNGHRTGFAFDGRGLRTSISLANGAAIAAAYDALGRQVSLTDPAGGVTRYEYDAVGNLIAVIDPLGHRTTYTYDGLRNRVSRTDALGNATGLAYDRLGRLTARVLPLGQTETRRYDAAGNLIELNDFNGRTSSFAYDETNRLVERSLPSGEIHRFEYTPTGQLAAMFDAAGTTRVSYDQRDRPTLLRQPGGAEISYAYDPAGNRAGVTTPAGAVLYSYDGADRLAAVEDTQGNRIALAHDAEGNTTGLDYPGGLTTSTTYDALNRPVTVAHRRGVTLLASFDHSYGPAGNRLRVTENDGRQVDYGYDALFQLTSERVSAPGTAPSTVSYTYDAAGNRTSRSDGSGSVSYAYDANSRLVTAGDISFTYDGKGNMIGRNAGGAVTTYSFDDLDRLVRAESPGRTATYSYDPLGNRVARSDGAAQTSYLVDPFGAAGLPVVLSESTPAGSAIADYVYAGDRLLGQLRPGSGVSYHLDDGTRSTRLLADSAGAVTDRYSYDAFGALRSRAGGTVNAYLYRAQEYDATDDLYNLRARRYDADTGRFLSRDPIFGAARMPQTLNPYLYALNDPVNRWDPSGKAFLADCAAAASISSIIAGLAVGSFSAFVTYQVTDGNVTYTVAAFGAGFAVGFIKLGPFVQPLIFTAPVAAPLVAPRAQALIDFTNKVKVDPNQALRILSDAYYRFGPRFIDAANQALQKGFFGNRLCNLIKAAKLALAGEALAAKDRVVYQSLVESVDVTCP